MRLIRPTRVAMLASAMALAVPLVGALPVQQAIAQDAEACHARAEVGELRHRAESLSPREREVMKLVVSGKLNKQSGHALGVTEKTIKVHRAQVMRKMQADSLADLVRMAEKIEHDSPQ